MVQNISCIVYGIYLLYADPETMMSETDWALEPECRLPLLVWSLGSLVTEVAQRLQAAAYSVFPGLKEATLSWLLVSMYGRRYVYAVDGCPESSPTPTSRT